MNKQVGLVSIENDVTRKIDRHRGVLTRAEFIDLCIDYCYGIERSIAFLSGRSQTDDIRSERSRAVDIRNERSRTADVLRGRSQAAGARRERSQTADVLRGRSRAVDIRSERSWTADVLRGKSRVADTRSETSRTVRPVPVVRRSRQVSYVTKEDLQEFNNGIKHLMEVALDLFMAFDIEKRTARKVADDWSKKRSDISERIQKLVHKKPREAEKVDLPQAYCVKCKKMVDIQNPEKVVLENGTPALKGTCPFSGTPVFRFVKKGTIME